MTTATTMPHVTEILARLNAYGGENIWNDVIYDYDHLIDFERTDHAHDAEQCGDTFEMVDGTVISQGVDKCWTADTPKDVFDALHGAGRLLVRAAYEALGEIPEYLADEITMQGDVDHLEDVARAYGLDGMPSGYADQMAPEWDAVFEGVRTELDALSNES